MYQSQVKVRFGLFICRDKRRLHTDLETLQAQVCTLESQCDELKLARQDSSREVLNARSTAQEQVRHLELRLEEQVVKTTKANQVIGHLREEVRREHWFKLD